MRLLPYIRIARPDHWFKHVFMLPGVVLACFFDPGVWGWGLVTPLLLALLSACLVASSNYVLNEILDADRDRYHPEKQHRPLASGEARKAIAYVEWALLAVAGLGLGFVLNLPYGLMALSLWIMGLLYNVPPVRLKDRAYADVISESVNNPIRLGMGWYATGIVALPPLSVALAYWMFGAFLMTTKRLAEFRHIGNPEQAGKYRSSFRHYTEERLIECLMFYTVFFAMLSGFFIARYHVELMLASPVVAAAMAYYMHLGFKPDSPVQYPEMLHHQPKLMALLALALITSGVALFVDWPMLGRWFQATPLVR